MNKLFFIAIFIASGTFVYAQKLNDDLVKRANELKKKYEDDKIVILKSTSEYEFYIDNKTNQLNASLVDNLEFISLQSGTEYIQRNYYNDNSYIEEYSIENDRGKSVNYEKYCGHVQSGDIFYSDAKVCAYNFKFDFKGRGINFKSKKVYTDPKYLTKIFFSDDIPVEQRTIKFKVPEFANIELVELNFDHFDIEKTVTREDDATIYTYNLKEIDDFSEYENTPGYLHFLPHILVLTKSYKVNGADVKVLSSTSDLYGWYHHLTEQVSRDVNQLKSKVTELTEGKTTDLEKMKSIYYWVQDNIKYIAFEDGLAGFKPDNAKDVFYNLYGDCKGMANLTREMLIIAGIDARLAWIGTNRIPYTYDLPTLAVDNHMICAAYIGGEVYFLDATEKFNKINYNAERIQGKQVLIEDGDQFIIDTVKVEPIDRYITKSVWNYKLDGQSLTGEGKTILEGEKKKDLLNFLNNQESEDAEKILKVIISGSGDVDHFQISNFSTFDREKPFEVSYTMDLLKNINSFGDELYLDLDFYEEFAGGRIDDERTIPYSFGDKKYSKTIGELSIPNGYKVNYLPEPISVENDYYSFKMKYHKEKGKIIYSKEVRILKPVLPVKEFTKWNETIKLLNNFYNDQIILQTAQ
ncbi:transglutaminase-like domain-containing protein [Marinigracilibium pacificum]|uniref:Transglutaminase domain-containing protein n=1 Tax=Marinigracilibium pacificum TaxID=2729599 RepID=A0A848J5F4_9BACT|nr:transglutaminase-like domain-containing protein [Marinigracilibium pacificum]NMM50705.1 transglutaminase domain-containing protein [Marinigracilibium pacificum]